MDKEHVTGHNKKQNSQTKVTDKGRAANSSQVSGKVSNFVTNQSSKQKSQHTFGFDPNQKRNSNSNSI